MIDKSSLDCTQGLTMIATARVVFDRSYFEMHYDDWLAHRSRFKKYEIWFAFALMVFGVTMAVVFRDQWLVGLLFASAGLCEFVMAATHRRRWVNARVAAAGNGKVVDLKFDSDALTSTSTDGYATMRLSGFAGFTAAAKGFFLIPESGMSIYVPRATLAPADAYDSLVLLLSSTITATKRSVAGATTSL